MSLTQLDILKQIELELLDEFVRICNKYKLNYFLSGGSCLGAIRHSGFIPWDDDIDVSMPRDDYQRFIELAPIELNSQYVLQCYETEENCGLIFAKIRKKGTVYSEVYSHHIDMSQGIWIDIFPYDYLPDNTNEQEKQYRKVQFYKNLYIIKSGYKLPQGKRGVSALAYYFAKIMLYFVPRKFLIEKLAKSMTLFKAGGEWVIPFGGAHTFNEERMPSSMMEEYIDVPFEGRTCKTLKQYDKYLSKLYGEYMQIPPEDKRPSGFHNVYEFSVEEL